MSYNAARWIFEQSITPTEKLVLLKLAHHAEPDGTKAYPSIDNIVRDTGIGKRQIQRYLKSFVERGFLSIDEHEKGGRGYTRTYSFTFAKGDMGDIQESPIDEIKGDILYTKRVTSGDVKGDIHAGAEVNTQEHPRTPKTSPTPSNVTTLAPPAPQPLIEKSRSRSRKTSDPNFDRFWDSYPNHDEKKAAVDAWKKLDPDDELVEIILAGVERQKQSRKWREGFIKAAHRFLKGENWTDGGVVAELPQAGPAGVALLPGEVATEVKPGVWEMVARDGYKRYYDPANCGVIFDQRKHMYSGLQDFYNEVNEARERKDQAA